MTCSGTSQRYKREEFTSGEVRRLLERCGETETWIRDQAILTLMGYCGLRTVEVHQLDVGGSPDEE